MASNKSPAREEVAGPHSVIPKYRRKALYGELRKHLGEVFLELAQQRDSKIEQGNLVIDHVPRLISLPPKYSVAQVIGFIKRKSAIHIARTYVGRKKHLTGHHFWARGDFVSTVGADKASIREYIRHQERDDKRLDQMNLF